jgi:hypothetical protein
MTNEVLQVTNAIIEVATNTIPVTATQVSAVSNGTTAWISAYAIIIFRWLRFELPAGFNWAQNYSDTHDGGLIEKLFHLIFGVAKTQDTTTVQQTPVVSKPISK